jgi:uncharacterized RDD family membrane protein YckC
MTRIGGMRIVAGLIDWAILVVVSIIVHFALFAMLGHGYAGTMLSGLVTAGIVLGYFYATEVLKAQSVGKMVLKYKITNQDGGPATQDQLLKRTMIKLAPWIISVVGAVLSFSIILSMLVGLVELVAAIAVLVMALMMLRDNRLAYYDELAGTAVYGPGTAPQGFPVMQPGAPGVAPMAPTGAPPPPPVPPTV